MRSHDIITAVPVAFDETGRLDLAGSQAILEYVAHSGVQGALVLGTTGEFPALSIDERNTLMRLSLRVLGDMRAIVHVGAASLFEVSQLLSEARRAGAREVALITPYFLSLTADDVFAYYQAALADASALGVHIYTYAARTGITVDEDLVHRLGDLDPVIGVKVSGEPLDLITAIRARLPEPFQVYTGSDRDFVQARTAGANGVISGVASALPKPFVAMREALMEGDEKRITSSQHDIDIVVDAIAGSPTRMRAVHRLCGGPVGLGRRMPHPEPDPAMTEHLAELAARFH